MKSRVFQDFERNVVSRHEPVFKRTVVAFFIISVFSMTFRRIFFDINAKLLFS